MLRFERRTLVEVQYTSSKSMAKPELIHKRLLALEGWPERATEQLGVLRDVMAAYEQLSADVISIRALNTAGPVYVVHEEQ